ncbi:hypothetical protein BDV12DRAFT_167932 [Aspergillus spectabilis]
MLTTRPLEIIDIGHPALVSTWSSGSLPFAAGLLLLLISELPSIKKKWHVQDAV